MTLLLRLCDPVAPLVLILRTSVRKANLFGFISQIQNIFVLFNSSPIREVMIKKHLRFQSYAHFTLVWRGVACQRYIPVQFMYRAEFKLARASSAVQIQTI